MQRKRATKRSEEMDVGRQIPSHKPTKEFLGSNEAPAYEQLFPGILDDITWHLIVPKLSWTALPVMSSVSRAWREAIRSGRVYGERVHADSPETLVLHLHKDASPALYSTSENRCYQLPPIPRVPTIGGVGHWCEWIAVGGKIYILGGMEVVDQGRVWENVLPKINSCGNVYVLDLGRGQTQWERCASMLEPRHLFGYGVIDDKIYVFGGKTTALEDGRIWDISRLCEVYDTRENVWSPIMPMIPSIEARVCKGVAPVGKELLLLNPYGSTVGVYNPAKDEWRMERYWERDSHSTVFVTEGKFYSFSESGIDVYDVERKSWINRHTHSFAPFARDSDSGELLPLHVSAVKDELFFTSYWQDELSFTSYWQVGCKGVSQSFFHCKGFDGEKKELVWQKTTCSFKADNESVVHVPIIL